MRVKSYTIDRTKKWQVRRGEKVISKHIDFYLAQTEVEKQVKRDFWDGAVNSNYKIEPIREDR